MPVGTGGSSLFGTNNTTKLASPAQKPQPATATGASLFGTTAAQAQQPAKSPAFQPQASPTTSSSTAAAAVNKQLEQQVAELLKRQAALEEQLEEYRTITDTRHQNQQLFAGAGTPTGRSAFGRTPRASRSWAILVAR